MKKYTCAILFITVLFNAGAFAADDNLLEFEKANVPASNTVPKLKDDGIFSLTTIMDSFLNTKKTQDVTLDETQKQRTAFVEATKKFNQGNVVVAYDEFENLLDNINSDYALLIFAKSMYEIGFFSIGTKSLEKIRHKDFLKNITDDLRSCYLPSFAPDKNEEIYLAKAYSSIHFDASAQETAFELT